MVDMVDSWRWVHFRGEEYLVDVMEGVWQCSLYLISLLVTRSLFILAVGVTRCGDVSVICYSHALSAL